MAGITRQNVKALFFYSLMLIAAIGIFLIVRMIGEESSVSASPAAVTSSAKTHGPNVLFHVLATLTAVIGLGFVLGRLFQRWGQPPVIGEVVAGICLGPSLLGLISPDLMHLLIPGPAADPHGNVAASLQMIAQLGVILYMFVIGLNLNADELKSRVHIAVAISHASIVVPFVLGSIASLWFFPRYAPSGVSFTSFSLFLGVAMSITAFPVLARILTDRGLETTRIGSIALACAAADDATAWCLLAVVVGIIQTSVHSAATVILMAATFVAAMFWIVRPLLNSSLRPAEPNSASSPFLLIAGLVGALLSALTTEWIGIHAIFGAFLFGAIIPHGSRLAHDVRTRLKDAVTILLLPAFFAYTGMRTEIGMISSGDDWLMFAITILVATLGKFGGTYFVARALGVHNKEAAALGTLMNTRGLMELIVLNIGLDLGVISPTLFAIMVVMALVTTMTTSPILMWLIPDPEKGTPN